MRKQKKEYRVRDGEIAFRGRGIHTWQREDKEKPTGPLWYPVFFFPADKRNEFLPLIEEVNRHAPRVGARLDPWAWAKQDFVKAGGRIEEYVGDTLWLAYDGKTAWDAHDEENGNLIADHE